MRLETVGGGCGSFRTEPDVAGRGFREEVGARSCFSRESDVDIKSSVAHDDFPIAVETEVEGRGCGGSGLEADSTSRPIDLFSVSLEADVEGEGCS